MSYYDTYIRYKQFYSKLRSQFTKEEQQMLPQLDLYEQELEEDMAKRVMDNL